MCAVVQCLTRDFLRLVNLLKSCNGAIVVISPLLLILPSSGLLQKFVAKPVNTQLSAADSRSLSMLILIVSLLCEHCDFDHLSEQREGMYEVSLVKYLTKSDPLWPRRKKRSASSLSGKQTLHWFAVSSHHVGPSIAQGSITDHIYAMLVRLYDKYSDSTLKGRLLQCLGD